MKKIFYSICFLMICISCKKESMLEPSGISGNYFEVSATSTDPIDKLRYQFYSQTGIYLLFNDTLRHELMGKRPNGEDYYKTELIEIGYGLGIMSSTKYDFKYLSNLKDCEKSTQFLQNYIVPKLGNAAPYSFLIVNEVWENIFRKSEGEQFGYYSRYQVKNAYGSRCVVIGYALSDESVSDKQRAKLFFVDYVAQLLIKSPDYGKFSSFSSKYYSKKWVKVSTLDFTDCREAGILSVKVLLGGMYWTFPSLLDDISQFVNERMTLGDKGFRKAYKDYPKVMQKYEIINSLIENKGLKL